MSDAAPPPWQPPNPLPNEHATERTLLRWLEFPDAQAKVDALDEDRSAYLPWLPWVRHENRSVAEAHYSIERCRRAHEEIASNLTTGFVLGIFDRRDGALLGGTGLHRLEPALHTAEIGHWIRPSRRGKGLCTEAVRGLIDWAFEAQPKGWGLRRVHIICAASNLASKRVPEKLGLRLEATRRADRWLDGLGWCDSLAWGVLREEWAELSR